MRVRALGALLAAASIAGACGISPAGLFRQYEYEEDVYLSLDAGATVYVNSSVLAFNALHGTSIDPSPSARIDDAVRQVFETPVTHVTRMSRPSRRNNRRYLHVRLDVRDINRMSEAAPFAWSDYQFRVEGAEYVFRQTVGGPTGVAAPTGVGPVFRRTVPSPENGSGAANWTGDEIVAFRLHLPSRITFHNTVDGVQRGNILVWEQSLRERLAGVPVTLEVRMETESILSSTLRLFGAAILAAAAAFGLAIWWFVRRGRTQA